MKTKHTTAPWSLPHFANGKKGCNCRWVLSECHLGSVCTIDYSTSKDWRDGDNPPLEEAIANAKLIRTSPDLLKFVIKMADRYSNSPWIYEEANKLIKKATE